MIWACVAGIAKKMLLIIFGRTETLTGLHYFQSLKDVKTKILCEYLEVSGDRIPNKIAKNFKSQQDSEVTLTFLKVEFATVCG